MIHPHRTPQTLAVACLLGLLPCTSACRGHEATTNASPSEYYRFDREQGREYFQERVVELEPTATGHYQLAFELSQKTYLIPPSASGESPVMVAVAREALRTGRALYATADISDFPREKSPALISEGSAPSAVLLRLAESPDPDRR